MIESGVAYGETPEATVTIDIEETYSPKSHMYAEGYEDLDCSYGMPEEILE